MEIYTEIENDFCFHLGGSMYKYINFRLTLSHKSLGLNSCSLSYTIILNFMHHNQMQELLKQSLCWESKNQ